jgi:phenylalanyl-tRNA synthetase beta chain
VIGRILAVESHPNADRLRVATVSTGAEPLQIVCGAPNIAPEQLVPVALVGAVLAGGIAIKQAKIRGIDSFGMLCAADELGISADHSGIMLLTGGTPGDAIDSYIPTI